jgi:hypothetical protein
VVKSSLGNISKVGQVERWLTPKLMISVSAILVSTACTKSPKGSVEELIKTRQPTFNGATYRLVNAPSAAYALNGECDPISYGIQYSTNNQLTWTDLASGCSNGAFQITLILSGETFVYVRANTKTGTTSASLAQIRIVLPPTSPYLKLVNAGRAQNDGANALNFEAGPISNETLEDPGNVKVQTSLVDIIYGP